MTRDPARLIVTDLDRTMIFSEDAMGGTLEEHRLQCVEFYYGRPLSYMTRRGAAALSDLAATYFVVPTTTRSVEQFTRLDLPGAPWPYAITSNGGNILVDGVVDPQWRRTVAQAIRAGSAPLDEVSTQLRTRIHPDWVNTFRVADELFCYLVVDPDAVPPDFLPTWSQWCVERGWDVSQQGRKIYVMPAAVRKSRAVAEVRSRLVCGGALTHTTRVLAAGDGGLDADMLAAADAGIRPRHGELEIQGWRHHHVVVTANAGIVASEEILTWFGSPDRMARRCIS